MITSHVGRIAEIRQIWPQCKFYFIGASLPCGVDIPVLSIFQVPESIRGVDKKSLEFHIRSRLGVMNLEKVFESLGDPVALICMEPPGVLCHRRLIAEIFQEALKIKVPEYGFSECPSFADLKSYSPPREQREPKKEVPGQQNKIPEKFDIDFFG